MSMTSAERALLQETHDTTISVKQMMIDHLSAHAQDDKLRARGVTRWEAFGQWAGVIAALGLGIWRHGK